MNPTAQTPAAATRSAQSAARQTGTVSQWNDARGFGFITSDRGGDPLFVHISAFPSGETLPQTGERVSFAPGRNAGGRPRAEHVTFTDRPPVRARKPPKAAGSPRRGGGPGFVAGVAMLAAAAAAFVLLRPASTAIRPDPVTANPPEATVASRCDGRTRCSQMTSCAEATWFLTHCPNTEMDGNRDGIPCESQWCTGPLGR